MIEDTIGEGKGKERQSVKKIEEELEFKRALISSMITKKATPYARAKSPKRRKNKDRVSQKKKKNNGRRK